MIFDHFKNKIVLLEDLSKTPRMFLRCIKKSPRCIYEVLHEIFKKNHLKIPTKNVFENLKNKSSCNTRASIESSQLNCFL